MTFNKTTGHLEGFAYDAESFSMHQMYSNKVNCFLVSSPERGNKIRFPVAYYHTTSLNSPQRRPAQVIAHQRPALATPPPTRRARRASPPSPVTDYPVEEYPFCTPTLRAPAPPVRTLNSRHGIRRQLATPSPATPSPATPTTMQSKQVISGSSSPSSSTQSLSPPPASPPTPQALISRSVPAQDSRLETTCEMLDQNRVRYKTDWGMVRRFVKVSSSEFWPKAFPNFVNYDNFKGGIRLPPTTAEVFRKAANDVLPGHMHVSV